MATNTWQNGSTYNDRYYNAFSYDANACPSGAKRRRGNILTQVRHNEAGTRVENLSYKYERNANGHLLRNRLYHVNETVSAGAFADDIDDQGTFTTTNINVNNNYGYDEEGRLVRDDAEDIAQIKWTVTSKVKEVIRSNGSPKKNLKFDYDASGKRIAKHVYNSSNVWEKSSYYTYDATGNVMAVYEKVSTDPDDPSMITYHVIERHMYGSARIGMNTAKAELSAATALPDTGNYVHLIGKKQFELSNHLGNVLSSISDKLIAKDWNNDQTVDSYKAEILFSQDYTPFGVKMDGRTFTNSYRYGFNGKETDDETGIQDYGFRMYNVLLGRFLSVDPLAKDYPWYTPYQFAGNKVIWAIDLDGEEEFIVTDFYNAAGQLARTVITVVNTNANGVMVHRSEVRPIAPGTAGFADPNGGAVVQYVGTTNQFRDAQEQSVALGTLTIAPIGAPNATFYQPITTAYPPHYQSNVVIAGAGVVQTSRAGNTITITDLAVPQPVLPYMPVGINAVPANISQRTDGNGNIIPCPGVAPGSCAGTSGTPPQTGNVTSNGTTAVANSTVPINITNVPQQNAANSPPPIANTGNQTVVINGSFARPTAGPSIISATPGTANVAPAGDANISQISNYANNNY